LGRSARCGDAAVSPLVVIIVVVVVGRFAVLLPGLLPILLVVILHLFQCLLPRARGTSSRSRRRLLPSARRHGQMFHPLHQRRRRCSPFAAAIAAGMVVVIVRSIGRVHRLAAGPRRFLPFAGVLWALAV